MPFPRLNKAIGPGRGLAVDSPEVEQLGRVLRESVMIRVRDIPEPPGDQRKKVRLAILFSGGLDCTVIARLAHECLPLEEGIDLLNVAFENKRVLEARTNKATFKRKGKKAKKGQDETNDKEEPAPDAGTDEVTIGLEKAYNGDIYEICPDRITGRKSLEELQRVCPGREWQFVQVNVPYDELLSHRQAVINLIYPHKTEMDLSIAVAFYFASRGTGSISIHNPASSETGAIEYATTARILLSGLGADELLGGYARHATAYRFHGYEGLLQELELDVGRLGKRNLGRDDRVLAHWGREGRYPFLDESVVRWALETEVTGKCGKDDEVMEGKRVLRLLAKSLGMESTALEKKRAVQFGSRSARMESGAKSRMKGTQVLT
jgi:asparagine synthetase B (glutamine-hydrolysing)